MSEQNKIKKKLQVGILSMQRIFNYGSFLQAYGLKSILEDLNCEVQFVDYHVGNCLIPSQGGAGISRKISKALEVFRYKAPLKEKIRFIKYKKNYAKNYYPYLGIDERQSFTPEVDLLVIGSDEVFNCVQSNSNVGFSPELFGQGHRAKKLISYAASFGNTTLEKLEKYHVEKKVSEWLKAFDAISVRDENSRSIVKSLTGIEPVCHLDPVLMYDYVGKSGKIPKSVPEKNYIIVYGYSGRLTDAECKQIRQYADSKKMKILCIGGVQNCCDKFIDCNPFEVIAYFQNAQAVVTDTFHGTILSVITHRTFASIVRSSGYGNSEKLTDLLRRLKLTDRIMPEITQLDTLLSAPIDYTETDEIIKTERQRTYEYLQQYIG